MKETAAFTLFESLLDIGDWRRAEQAFPLASKRLTPSEVPEWYSQIAVIAAKAGAQADALRIWTSAANVNPARLEHLDQLAENGLRQELIAFYRNMGKQMPRSEVPAKAIAVLEAKR